MTDETKDDQTPDEEPQAEQEEPVEVEEASADVEEEPAQEEPAEEEPAEEQSSDEDAPAGPVLPIKKSHVEDLLGELAEISEKGGLVSIADEVRNERIPALRKGRMSVVVLGEFNHGKSTVVNALLGEEILPTGITPTTAVITHLVHGDEPKAEIQPPRGGERTSVSYDEMGAAIRHEEESGEEPEYVEIQYPNELLEDSLVLVDTPGVNDISRQKVEITYGYVPKADVILYVLDATQVLKKSEITFIKDRLLKANRDRIIFVLGKTDALSSEDVKEVETYARERLEDLIGPVELFAFSGRESLLAQKEGREPPAEFTEFRKYLLSFLRDNKAYILVDSALGSGLRVAGLLEQNLAIKKQGYLLEKEDLERRIGKVEKKLEQSRQLIAQNIDHIDESIGGIAATARHNLRSFIEEFKTTLPQQIERAEARDVKLYLSAWIQDSFKDWLEDEGDKIANSLEELAEEVIEITNESMRETVGVLRNELGLKDQLDLDVDTIAYDVSVFAVGTLGLSVLFFAPLIGGLLALTAPALAMFFKGKVDEKVKGRAREEGTRVIDEVGTKIEEQLLAVIYEYGERLEQFVEHAGDRLYSQIQEVLGQVQREMATKRDRKELAADVDELLQATRRVAKLIRSSREKL
jgi:ribosome biogenesis GTPase A